MINIFLFLSGVFLLVFIIGRIIERIKIPWIFAALILGSLLSVYNPFTDITTSATFDFLAQLGLYFLLFVIGFEINLKKLKKESKFILKATFFIILLEAMFGSLVVHFIFGYDWFLSFVVALSFATVGEAILIPILDEFKIVNTKLGQTIIGIGTFDDIIEIFILILVVVLVGSDVHEHISIGLIIASLFSMLLLAAGLTKLKKEGKRFNFLSIETLFLFTIFTLFLFLGIGEYAESAPLAALLSGIALKTFIPEKRLKLIESEVKTLCYGFFAPLFFLEVGISMNINYLISYPILILLVASVSGAAKILGSYLIGRKEFNMKKSVLLGIGLSVRFSTSIVIIKILFDDGLIDANLYSPILFSNLISKWKIAKQKS